MLPDVCEQVQNEIPWGFKYVEMILLSESAFLNYFSRHLLCNGVQVRIVVHSSVHPQNATLNEFLSRIPDAPTPLHLASASPSSPWKLGRSELLKHIATAEAETELDDVSDEMQKLLLYTMDVSKPTLCSPAETSSHFFRIFTQLMRTFVSGKGTPSLLWANPASVIPLRMHAFATLLQIINGMNTYMVRNGCTQLDGGKSRWNLTELGRVVAMVFDEEQLESSGEVFSEEEWKKMYISPTFSRSSASECGEESTTSQGSRPREKIRTRQPQKTNVGTSEVSDGLLEEESLDDLLAALASDAEIAASNVAADTSEPPTDSGLERVSPPDAEEDVESTTSRFKIDSKSDFQNNLWASSAESSSLVSSASGSTAAHTMIQAYSGVGPSNRRKWMTAPTSGLATIREDAIREDADPGDSDFNESAPDLGAVVTPISPEHPGDKNVDGNGGADALDTELVLRDRVAERKKMRVPRRVTNQEEAKVIKPSGSTLR